jgi:hypothetical protein
MSRASEIPKRLKRFLKAEAENQGCFKHIIISAGLLMFLEASQKDKDRAMRLLKVYK